MAEEPFKEWLVKADEDFDAATDVLNTSEIFSGRESN